MPNCFYLKYYFETTTMKLNYQYVAQIKSMAVARNVIHRNDKKWQYEAK